MKSREAHKFIPAAASLQDPDRIDWGTRLRGEIIVIFGGKITSIPLGSDGGWHVEGRGRGGNALGLIQEEPRAAVP